MLPGIVATLFKILAKQAAQAETDEEKAVALVITTMGEALSERADLLEKLWAARKSKNAKRVASIEKKLRKLEAGPKA